MPWRRAVTRNHGLALMSLAVVGAVASGVGFGAAALTQQRQHLGPAKVLVRNPAGGTLLSIACAGKRQCAAVGDDSTFFGPRKELGQWSGGRWRVKLVRGSKHAVGDLLNAVSCPTTRECLAVGTHYLRNGVAVPLAQVLSRSRWTVVSAPAPPVRGGSGSRLSGLSCLSVRNCFAVGFDQTRSGTVTLAEHWDGARWRIQPTPNAARSGASMLIRVSCATARACTAIGTFISRSGLESAFAERWGGIRWRIQPTASIKSASGYALTGIFCPAIKFCFAVGGFAGRDQTLAETWYGIRWRTNPTPSPAHELASTLSDVFCRSPKRCTAVGFYRPDYHRYGTLIEAWNGIAWRIQPSPNRSRVSDLFGVACPAARECIAVGDYSTRLGLRRTLVETWYGIRWRIAPFPADQ